MFDPDIHHRRSVRLRDHDYLGPEWYFVTICTHERKCTLGRIVQAESVLSELGAIVRDQWLDLARRLPNVELGSFVVMPNHMHGIIAIVRPSPHRVQGQGASPFAETMLGKGADSTDGSHAKFEGTLGAIVRSFKSEATREARRLLGDARFCLWQRSYHDHVIRGYRSLDAIQRYINENPLHWAYDPDHPDGMRKSHL